MNSEDPQRQSIDPTDEPDAPVANDAALGAATAALGTPEEGGATPAVALTAYVRMEDRLRIFEAGFQQYVPKPIDAAEFSDAVLRLASQRHER